MPLFSSTLKQDQTQGQKAFANFWIALNIGLSTVHEHLAGLATGLHLDETTYVQDTGNSVPGTMCFPTSPN